MRVFLYIHIRIYTHPTHTYNVSVNFIKYNSWFIMTGTPVDRRYTTF